MLELLEVETVRRGLGELISKQKIRRFSKALVIDLNNDYSLTVRGEND